MGLAWRQSSQERGGGLEQGEGAGRGLSPDRGRQGAGRVEHVLSAEAGSSSWSPLGVEVGGTTL